MLNLDVSRCCRLLKQTTIASALALAVAMPFSLVPLATSNAAEVGLTDKEIKVGILGSLTGPAAISAQAISPEPPLPLRKSTQREE